MRKKERKGNRQRREGRRHGARAPPHSTQHTGIVYGRLTRRGCVLLGACRRSPWACESKERKKCPRRASAPTTARPRRRRRRGSPSARSPSASCRDITSSTSTRLGARFLVACARDSTSGRGKARAQALAVHMRERGVRDADAACVRCECGS